MAVCRKRSTNMAPDFLSTSYLTGAPPCGISMMTLTSCGGFSPTGMWERSIDVRPWLPAAVEDCHTVTLARWEPLPHCSRSEAIDWTMIRLPSNLRSASHEHFRRHHVSDFRPFGQGGNPRSRHRGAFSLNSAASLASSVRHHDKNRACTGGP